MRFRNQGDGAMITHDLRTLARLLGGSVAGRSVLCPGPGHSRRDRSLEVTANTYAPDGFLVRSFAGDDWRDCRDYVRERLGLPQWEPGNEQDRQIHPRRIREWDRRLVDAAAETRPQPHSDEDRARIRRARAIWDVAVDPRGTLAETYFGLRRLAFDDSIAGRVLRFHAACPWRNENTGKTEFLPALVAAFRSIDDDTITGIHRIALNPDGTKISRRMLGLVQRAAIKLDDAVDDELAVGEGTETCIAARMLGIKPVWALGSVGMISHFPLVPGIRTLRIIGENDTASEDATELCGARWSRAGVRVRVIKPTLEKKDLNDALGAHAYDGTGR
jgi:putative DNA primase/helicase